jgi:hypothetical protein
VGNPARGARLRIHLRNVHVALEETRKEEACQTHRRVCFPIGPTCCVERSRLARFAEVFKSAKRGSKHAKETKYDRLMRMKGAAAMRHAHEMKKIESAYAKSLSNIGSLLRPLANLQCRRTR